MFQRRPRYQTSGYSSAPPPSYQSFDPYAEEDPFGDLGPNPQAQPINDTIRPGGDVPQIFGPSPTQGQFGVGYDPSRGDVNGMVENERARASNQADIYNQEFRDLGPYALDRFGNYANQADDQYANIAAGGGGYNDAELDRIYDDQGVADLDFRPGEDDGMFLSADEQAGIVGNPYQRLDHLNPALIAGHAQDAQNRGREALDGSAPIMRDIYGDADLRMDAGVGAGIAAGGGRIRSAVDRQRLALDPNFKDEFVMDQGDIDTISTLAGRTAAAGYEADFEEANRRAAGSGMNTSMAMGALRNRLRRHAAMDASDATTAARLGGEAQRRGQIGTAEQMRLDAERGFADRVITGENVNARNALDAEGIRLGAASNQAGMGLDAEGRLLSERINHEARAGDRNLDAAIYNSDIGSRLAGDAEDRMSDRRARIAGNRQGTARANADGRFDRNLAQTDRRSDRGRTQGDARRGDEQEMRAHTQTQADRHAGIYNAAADRRIQGVESASDRSLSAAAERRRRRGPGMFERIVGMGVNTALRSQGK